MENKQTFRPFGMRDKLGYMFGDFGNDFSFILASTFLLKFYTDVMAVPAAVVGTIMMIARFADAFTDVTMGRICDSSKTLSAGKFKPWILRMCWFVAAASFLMYQSALADAIMTVKIAYLFVTYILWGSVFYTSINIPYGSMASTISAEPDDRQSLSTFRTMGGMLAGIFTNILPPLLVYDKVMKDGVEQTVLNGPKFTLMAGIFAVASIGCYLLCYKLVTERVRVNVDPILENEKPQMNSVGTMIKNAVTNRALLSIICASIVMLLAQLTMQQMASYVYPNFYNNATAQSASTAFMGIGMIVAAIVSKPLARKFGKAEVSVVTNLFAGVVLIICWIIRPANVWVFAGFQMLVWLGLGIFSMVSWALITDVIDYSEIKNGIREDGQIYSLYSFARKLGQALSAGVSGWLLQAIGYSAKTAFDPAVTNGIFNISTLVPAIGLIALALILWFWYPLHKKTVDANVAFLKEKHGR